MAALVGSIIIQNNASPLSLLQFQFTEMQPSAYLRLLIFLPAILIPACASSSPALLMMYSAYKLNKQGDNIQPRCWARHCPGVINVSDDSALKELYFSGRQQQINRAVKVLRERERMGEVCLSGRHWIK